MDELEQFLNDNNDEASYDLDDMVHDAALSMASNANNEGKRGQVNFLKVVCGWSDEDILQTLKEKKC